MSTDTLSERLADLSAKAAKPNYRRKLREVEAFRPGPDDGPLWADDPRIRYYCPRDRDRSQWFFHVLTDLGVGQGRAGKDWIAKDEAGNLHVFTEKYFSEEFEKIPAPARSGVPEEATEALPWRDMATAPHSKPIIARHKPNEAMPHGWVGVIRRCDPEVEDSRFGHPDEILHYNGDRLLNRFYGGWDGWLPIEALAATPVSPDTGWRTIALEMLAAARAVDAVLSSEWVKPDDWLTRASIGDALCDAWALSRAAIAKASGDRP